LLTPTQERALTHKLRSSMTQLLGLLQKSAADATAASSSGHPVIARGKTKWQDHTRWNGSKRSTP
jgi:hypothetical protein